MQYILLSNMEHEEKVKGSSLSKIGITDCWMPVKVLAHPAHDSILHSLYQSFLYGGFIAGAIRR